MNQNAYSEQPADIDTAKVRRLAKDYGIDCDVLAKELPQIAFGFFHQRDNKNNEPDTEEVKRHIKVMRNAAETLSKKINTLPIDSVFEARLTSRYEKTYRLGDDLDKLINVLDNLNPKGWKKNGNQVSRDSLIVLLGKLWNLQTGKPITSSTKTGRFIAFMCECADILGIDSSPLPGRFLHLKRKYKGRYFKI